MITCENCKKEIKNRDTACYARETSVYLCSLDCLADYAHECLGCVPLNVKGDEKQNDQRINN